MYLCWRRALEAVGRQQVVRMRSSHRPTPQYWPASLTSCWVCRECWMSAYPTGLLHITRIRHWQMFTTPHRTSADVNCSQLQTVLQSAVKWRFHLRAVAGRNDASLTTKVPINDALPLKATRCDTAKLKSFWGFASELQKTQCRFIPIRCGAQR